MGSGQPTRNGWSNKTASKTWLVKQDNPQEMAGQTRQPARNGWSNKTTSKKWLVKQDNQQEMAGQTRQPTRNGWSNKTTHKKWLVRQLDTGKVTQYHGLRQESVKVHGPMLGLLLQLTSAWIGSALPPLGTCSCTCWVYRLAGLVVKESDPERKIWGLNPAGDRTFPGRVIPVT